MNETHFFLTEDERGFLVDFLAAGLKKVQVEEHRTRNLSYRQRVTHEKEMITRVLEKLGEAGLQHVTPLGAAL